MSSRLSAFLVAVALSGALAAPADARRGSGGGASATQAPAQTTGEPVTLSRSETKAMQRALGVTPDGEIGPQTRAALKRYERSQGMVADGEPDAAVLEALGVEWSEEEATAAPAPTGRASAVVSAARSAIGSPYSSGGTTTAGFDCSGLTTWAFRKAGVRLPRTSFEQYEIGRPVETEDIQAGDLVFWDAAGAGASHVGIAVSNTRVISATSSGGVMEHAMRTGYWGDHFLGARRR